MDLLIVQVLVGAALLPRRLGVAVDTEPALISVSVSLPPGYRGIIDERQKLGVKRRGQESGVTPSSAALSGDSGSMWVADNTVFISTGGIKDTTRQGYF